MANLTYPQIYTLATNAGFSGQSANTITAIALAESGGNPYSINAKDPGGSYGLTQINGAAWGAATALTAYGNPQTAMDLAYQISNGGQNFSAWSTYNNGAYKQYLQAGSTGTVPTSGSAAVSGASALPNTNPLIFTPEGEVYQAPAGGGPPVNVTGQPGTYTSPTAAATAATSAIGTGISNAVSGIENWLGSIGGNLGIAVLAIVLFLIAVWPVAKPVIVSATKAAAEG